MRRNTFTAVIVSVMLLLASCVTSTCLSLADDVTAEVDISLKPGKNVGVGFNLLPLTVTRLEATLSPPLDYAVVDAEPVFPDGNLVWNRISPFDVPEVVLRTEGLAAPHHANVGYGVRFEGELMRLVPGDSGCAPSFKASIAHVDIDVDSMAAHLGQHWPPSVGNSLFEDVAESTIAGGLEVPPLHMGALPAMLPDDAGYRILRLRWARVKWGGHPDGTPNPDYVGKLTFDISGPGLALYHLDGAKARIVSGEEAVEVPVGGLSNIDFGILTNEQFTVSGAITARYVWRSGLEGNTAYGTAVDWVRVRPASHVSLTIDDVPDTQKTDPGAVVVRNDGSNDPPRKKIWLHSSGMTGEVILTRSNAKVDVFTHATGGTPLTFDGADNRFPVGPSSMPLALFVEGTSPSDTMGDVTLTLSDESSPPNTDSVTFTVLWVTISMRHEGVVSDDNAAKAFFETICSPPPGALGYQFIDWSASAFHSLASEFIGLVAPADFNLSDFTSTTATMRLNRHVDGGIIWWGPTGKEFSEPMDAVEDLSLPDARDDDPQSDRSGGKLFDLDAPGLGAFSGLAFDRKRYRVNFTAFAEYNEGSGWVRCSPEEQWHTCQSYKRNAQQVEYTGKVHSATTDTLVFDGADWNENQWRYGAVEITSGYHKDQVRRIVTNTGSTLVVTPPWVPAPVSGSTVTVVARDTWVQDAEYDGAGDNKNDAGHTTLTYDLQQ